MRRRVGVLSFIFTLLLLMTLVLVGSYSMQILEVNANGFNVEFSSEEKNGVTSNLGTIFFDPQTMVLPKTRGPSAGSYPIIYNPAEGYSFVKWETTGGVTVTDPNIQSTTMIVTGAGTVTAVYLELALMSLEHGGTTDVMGSREFIVPVCNEFDVELWVRNLPESMGELCVYITWDPDLMELRNFKYHTPSGWNFFSGPSPPFDLASLNSIYVCFWGGGFSLDRKWMTLTFHCKGEGTSPINMPESHNELPIGPFASFQGVSPIPNTKLKAAVTQTPEPPPVAGLVTPTNKLEILAPYLALAGLIAAVSTVYVVKRRKD